MSGNLSKIKSGNFFSQRIFNEQKYSIITLGCARNLVDSQVIIGKLKEQGKKIVGLEQADVAVINTCAFVEDAKRESIDGILDLIEMKNQGKLKRIIVAGCLSERYAEELNKEFSEIDAFVGVQELEREGTTPDILLTPEHFAYVKICESCYNQCSFCIIPKIKGEFASRTIEAVVKEVKALDSRGVKEINIVGQDITAYGIDIYKEKKLDVLLKEICKETESIEWIRLLYMFPSHITNELIDVIAKEDKICKYIDIPLQHISDKILKAMNRGSPKEQTVELVKKLRENIPGVILRTTFIVGFPGETDEDFNELYDFVKQTKFDKLGVFIYSQEEGTAAFNMEGQVSEDIKKQRFNKLMSLQREISGLNEKKYVGKQLDVIIDGESFDAQDEIGIERKEGEHVYLARTRFDAPDVDGIVYLMSKEEQIIGDIVTCEIKGSLDYDLIGEKI